MLSWSKQVRKPQSQMFVVKNVFWCSCCADVSERVLSGSWRDQPKQIFFNLSAKSGFMIINRNVLKLWMAYFLHELMQHVCSSPSFEKTVCSPQIWIAYFLLEQMQHDFSSHSFEKIYVHKLHIWMIISIMNWWNMFF